MSKLKSTLAGILIGGAIGYAAHKVKQPEYTLKEKNNITYVKTKSNKKSYEINETQRDFYFGGIEHNLQGVKERAYQNGLEQKDESEYNRRDELEKIIQEKYEEIRRNIR